MSHHEKFLASRLRIENNLGSRHLQLSSRIRGLITDGTLASGDALPPERELAALAKVSRVTVRRAIAFLVEEGLLEHKAGSGNFVKEKFEQPLSLLRSFSEDMRLRGLEPDSIWLFKSCSVASPNEAIFLNISPGAPVLRFKRIRTANKKPIAIETAVVSTTFLANPELVKNSFYKALNEQNLMPVRALQRIRARIGTPEECKLLELDNTKIVLEIERVSYLADRRALEVTFSAYRADIYDFVVELQAPTNGSSIPPHAVGFVRT